MNKCLLLVFLAFATLSFTGCSKSDSEVQNESSIIGTWSTPEDTEQMIAVFGTDKSFVLTIKSNGKKVSVQTYSYFVEGNKLTTVFIEEEPVRGRKRGEIETETISLTSDKLIVGELVYTRVK